VQKPREAQTRSPRAPDRSGDGIASIAGIAGIAAIAAIAAIAGIAGIAAIARRRHAYQQRVGARV
jgi:hypothetical protein